MRVILGGLAALALSTNAWSADLLRGSTPAFGETRSYNWAGVYIGGQAGYSNVDFGFDNTVVPLVANLMRGTRLELEGNISERATLGSASGRAGSYGGFIGYNSQWGDIVLGSELNYNKTSITASDEDVVSRFITLGTILNEYTITSRASATLTDYGTLRFRAGYALNWIMPYAMVGLALGRADVIKSVEIDLLQTPEVGPPVPVFLTDSITKTGVFSVGYMLGAGVDIGLMPGVFLRAEYEYVQFANFSGVSTQIQTGRVGAAIKF
jgi:opacity protein-like surface antigen